MNGYASKVGWGRGGDEDDWGAEDMRGEVGGPWKVLGGGRMRGVGWEG